MWVLTTLLTCWPSQAEEAGPVETHFGDLCGRHALSVGNASLDPEGPPVDWERLLPQSEAPFSLEDLSEAAATLSLRSRTEFWPDEDRAEFAGPCILHVRRTLKSPMPDHFVFCFGETEAGLVVSDFPRPNGVLPRSALAPLWDGVALYLDDHAGDRLAAIGRGSAEARWMNTGRGVLAVLLVATLLTGVAQALRSRRPKTDNPS